MFNLIAPFNRSGYGVVGANLLAGLHAELGSALHYENIGGGFDYEPNPAFRTLDGVAFDSPYPTLFVWHHTDLSRLMRQEGPKALYTFFEVSALPQSQVDELNRLDFILQPSEWGKEVLERSGVTVPVGVLRPGVDRSIFNENVEPAKIDGVGDETLVLFSAGKWEVRKGYDILLDVLHRAFSPQDDVLLVVNAANRIDIPGQFDGPQISKEWAYYYESSPLGRAGKILINRVPLETQNDLASLMAKADLGVFMSRAEGWGLEAAEMLSMGKRVLLSDATAHQEFGGPGGATMVPFGGAEVALERPWFDGSTFWANPTESDRDSIAKLLRSVYLTKATTGSIPPNAQGVDFSENNTWGHTTKRLLTFFLTSGPDTTAS